METRDETAIIDEDLGPGSVMTGKGNGPGLQNGQIEIETKAAAKTEPGMPEEVEIARGMHGEIGARAEAEIDIVALKVCITY